MHTGEISFCDKICFNIKSNDYKKQILDELEKICKFRVIQKHHENFKETLIPILKSKPHLLSIRSNGNPYLLYLTKYNNVNQCIFIDKKIQQGYFFPRMILSKIRFDDELFKGTIFDGEMVKGEKWVFLINDIYCNKSRCTFEKDVVDRINIIIDILETKYIEEDISCCDIQVKKYFKYDQIDDIKKFVNCLPYSSRGVYFKPMYIKFRDILYNFDDTVIKKINNTKSSNKVFQESNLNIRIPDKEVTQDEISHVEEIKTDCIFYGKKTSIPDVYELYESVESNKFIDHACVMKLTTSKLLKEIFQNANITQKIPLYCEFNEKFKKWTPVKKI